MSNFLGIVWKFWRKIAKIAKIDNIFTENSVNHWVSSEYFLYKFSLSFKWILATKANVSIRVGKIFWNFKMFNFSPTPLIFFHHNNSLPTPPLPPWFFKPPLPKKILKKNFLQNSMEWRKSGKYLFFWGGFKKYLWPPPQNIFPSSHSMGFRREFFFFFWGGGVQKIFMPPPPKHFSL